MSLDTPDQIHRFVVEHYQRAFTGRAGEQWYSRVMKPLVDSVAESEHLLAEAEAKARVDPFRLEGDTPETFSYLREMQLGMFLVLCQAYITQVLGLVSNMHRDFEGLERDGIAPLAARMSKRELMVRFAPKVEGTGFSTIEVIDALANYFKHHEEWGGDWDRLQGLQKRTVEIARSAGVADGPAFWRAGNLHRCLGRLGVKAHSDLLGLMSMIDDWKANIWTSYATEPGVVTVGARWSHIRAAASAERE